MGLMAFLKKLFTRKSLVVTKEDEFNNKYPKSILTYTRHETDGSYDVDLRDFIFEYDDSIPTVIGANDDEKALNGLFYIRDNIEYTEDIKEFKSNEYWAYPYQTLHHKKGDCEDGAILLYNILLRSGVPYWKMRLTAGFVKYAGKQVGHAYLTYYCEETDRWVVLDWCYYPNYLKINEKEDYKNERNYLEIWFSWNQKYCFTKGLNTEAMEILK